MAHECLVAALAEAVVGTRDPVCIDSCGQILCLCHFLGVRDPCPSLGLLTLNCHHRSCLPMPFCSDLGPSSLMP